MLKNNFIVSIRVLIFESMVEGFWYMLKLLFFFIVEVLLNVGNLFKCLYDDYLFESDLEIKVL